MTQIIISVTAILGFTGVGIQFYYTLMRKLAEGHSVLYSINHFYSYFTIIINTLLALLLSWLLLFPQSKLSRWFRRPSVNGAMALYILIVGIIYYTLLHNPDKPFTLEVVATHLLHGFVPPAYFALWFFSFRQVDLKYRDTIKWLIFPLFYFIYIILRGEVVKKYPYFFVDIEKYGYARVSLNALGVLLVFLFMGSILVFLDRNLKKSKEAPVLYKI